MQDAGGEGNARREHKSLELDAPAGHRRQQGQGRQNLRREPPGIPNHTQPPDTDVRNVMGDRVFGGNLEGFCSTCTQSGPSSEGRSDIGSWQGQHRQALHTKVAVTQREGESHTVDYTRVGFETRSFFPCVRAGLPEDIVYQYVNSGITVADMAASSTSEPTTPRGLLTALHRLGS